MKSLALALVFVFLTGCGSLQGQFTNRPVCTMDKKDAYVVSFWTQFLGLAFEIDKRDTPVICK